MIRQADNLGRDAAFPAHAHGGNAAFAKRREDTGQPDISQPGNQRQAVDAGHFQKLGVSIGNAAQYPGVNHRQHMGKADNDRKVGTAHPQQSQNDKAGHRHGADELHGRLNKNADPTPAGTQRAQQQSAKHGQQKARQDAQGAECNALPEYSCRRQPSQRLQRLYRRGEEQPAMP